MAPLMLSCVRRLRDSDQCLFQASTSNRGRLSISSLSDIPEGNTCSANSIDSLLVACSPYRSIAKVSLQDRNSVPARSNYYRSVKVFRTERRLLGVGNRYLYFIFVRL